MRMRCSSVYQQTGNLSGGNQQKVILSKWLFADPEVLIVIAETPSQPTGGIGLRGSTWGSVPVADGGPSGSSGPPRAPDASIAMMPTPTARTRASRNVLARFELSMSDPLQNYRVVSGIVLSIGAWQSGRASSSTADRALEELARFSRSEGGHDDTS